jgi:hypothetical protein
MQYPDLDAIVGARPVVLTTDVAGAAMAVLAAIIRPAIAKSFALRHAW